MSNDMNGLVNLRRNPADRPLLGLTVLLVEDSRFASEAMRLLCQRSGARLRRADCLRSARRHLQSYRPSVVIVDLGLPDGPGEDLIAELAGAVPRLPVILATSGDPGAEEQARAAGADGFLPKPVDRVGVFQAVVLSQLGNYGQRAVTAADADVIDPDRLALRDDLAHAADRLRGDGDIIYLAGFISGVARSARDSDLETAASALIQSRDPVAIFRLIEDRLAAGSRF